MEYEESAATHGHEHEYSNRTPNIFEACLNHVATMREIQKIPT